MKDLETILKESLGLEKTPQPEAKMFCGDCIKAMEAAVNAKLQEAEMSYTEEGREGCTYGDTEFDSCSVAYGYNLAKDEFNDRLRSLQIKEQ